MKETNIEAIKSILLSFLYLDIEETDISFIVSHPIFDSQFQFDTINNEMVNIIENKDAYKRIIKLYENKINNTNFVNLLFYLVRKPYLLTFIKFAEPYLSLEDFSSLLAKAWVISENPNQDINVSISKIIKMFKKADKKYLMDEQEFEIYNNLPETFIAYRGVSKRRNPKGLSWTINLEKAKWFSNRFGKGYVQQATINKNDVLAYFNSRGEDEIVVNIKNLKDITIIET